MASGINEKEDEAIKKVEATLTGFVDGLNDAHPLIQYLVLVCALDAAANYWCGRKSVGCASAVFKSFVQYYLPVRYQTLTQTIFRDMRCALVHNFTIGSGIVLTAGNPNLQNLDPKGKEVPLVNLEDFKKTVKNAIAKLVEDARKGVSAPVFNDPSEGSENYCYTFKDSASRVLFLTKDEYEAVQRIDGKDVSTSSVSDDDKKWVFAHRAKYKELREKYEFIAKVKAETSSKRALSDNFLQTLEEIKPLHAKDVSRDVNGMSLIERNTCNPFTSSNALTSTTMLEGSL